MTCLTTRFTRRVADTIKWLTQRPLETFIFTALICTIGVKLFHALRLSMLQQYPIWIFSDIAVLTGFYCLLKAIQLKRPDKFIVRLTAFLAGLTCLWSFLNAAWVIRTGTQILPTVLLPLFRAPLNALAIVWSNMIKMPLTSILLLTPFLAVIIGTILATLRPSLPSRIKMRFKIVFPLAIILILLCIAVQFTIEPTASAASGQINYNAQLRALTMFTGSARITSQDLERASRTLPRQNQLSLSQTRGSHDYNLLLIVLEGIQYDYTSMSGKNGDLTPFLADLAQRGITFSQTRCTLTHTTKALFSLLTGRYPSVTQDIVETVPVNKPFASLATILENRLGYSTAFFQSAKGAFESRPGLAHNLGFDRFTARENIAEPNSHLGSLGSDEFQFLAPLTEWMNKNRDGFFATYLCSATHDPYEVPDWYSRPFKKPAESYKQTIRYTDSFIRSLYARLKTLGLDQNTIICVIGDHAEAFGEHGLHGHERIAFEEALRIPWIIKTPPGVGLNRQIKANTSSIDLAPTLLELLGFDTTRAQFDGINALGDISDNREVFFSGWLNESPLGFVKDNKKFVYDPLEDSVSIYRINGIEKPIQPAPNNIQTLRQKILNWRKDTILQLPVQPKGEKWLYHRWFCTWEDRISEVRCRPCSSGMANTPGSKCK